ncbi:TPA: hypothetical protein ACTXW8_000182 [Legionella anisa]
MEEIIMFSKLLNNPVPEFSQEEVQELINKIVALFSKGGLSQEAFVDSINEIFTAEKRKLGFWEINDSPQEKAKRQTLQHWQNTILATVEGKKNLSLNDVNNVVYEAAQAFIYGFNPQAYRLLCLSSIREALDNNRWMEFIDGLSYRDRTKGSKKPTSEEIESFLREKVAPLENDAEFEELLKDDSCPFFIDYSRVQSFISNADAFKDKQLSPLEKIAYCSIFTDAGLKVRAKLYQELPEKDEQWIEMLSFLQANLHIQKPQSSILTQVYSELFSEATNLREVAEHAGQKITDLTQVRELPEVNAGLEVFFERVAVQMRDVTIDSIAQKIDETFDKIGQGVEDLNETINEGIDSLVEVVTEVPQKLEEGIGVVAEKLEEVGVEVGVINQPEPYESFFTQNIQYMWNYTLPIHVANPEDEQQQEFIMTVDKAERMANLKAYFEGRIAEISQLEDNSYATFMEKFAEEIRGLSVSETIKEGLSEESVDFENLKLYLRFALPFSLLKESLSENLDETGQRRVNELSSLIMESTSNVLKKWVPEQPSVKQIDYVLGEMQKASAYLSPGFQDELDHTIETINTRKLYVEETEVELHNFEKELDEKEDYLDEMEEELHVIEAELDEAEGEQFKGVSSDTLQVSGGKTLQEKREELNSSREQLATEREALATSREALAFARERLEAEKKQFEVDRKEKLTEIEDYLSTVVNEKGWEFTASLLKTDSATLHISYRQQINDETQRKLEEEQREIVKELEEKQRKIAEEQENQRKQDARQQELAAWQPKKNACLRLIDKEIKRLDEFSLFANDEITQERIIAFNTLRKKVESTRNIGQLCLELKNFENSTIPFIRENETEPRNRAVSDILKSDRFSSKAEISEDTKSNKFFQSLKKRAMTDYVVQLRSKLREEPEPIARKTFIDKIQELMREIAQIRKKKAPQLEVVEEVLNPIQPQVVVEVENPVQSQVVEAPIKKEAAKKEKGPNLKDEKAVASHITRELRAFIQGNPEWFNDNRKVIPKKTVGVVSAMKDAFGVDQTEVEIIKRQQILGDCTERKINAIAKIIKEIKKLQEDKGSFATNTPHQRETKIGLLLGFMKDLGLEWELKENKTKILPALVNDNVSVTGVRNRIFGNPEGVMNPAFHTLGFQKKSTFFGEPALQTFVKELPEKVKEPKVKEPQPEESMDLGNLFQ